MSTKSTEYVETTNMKAFPGHRKEEDGKGDPYPWGFQPMEPAQFDPVLLKRAEDSMQKSVDDAYEKLKRKHKAGLQPEPAEGYEWRVNHQLSVGRKGAP